MDRREALKKMMAGGAVVAGASMVSSSPVFAAGSTGGPIGGDLTTPPPPVAFANDKRSNTWLLTAPTVRCSSGTPQVSSYATIVAMSSNLSVLMTPSGFGYVPGTTATLTVVGLWPGSSPFRQGDTFEVTWHVQYACMVNGVRAGCQVVNYTYRYVNQNNGNPNWQPYPGYPIAVAMGSCVP